MRGLEVVRYGSIEAYYDVGCLLEFYDKLGLTPRFGVEDICHVDQLRISEKDHRRLRDLIQAKVRCRESFLIGRVRDSAVRTARANWFSRAPLPDEYIPEGELWIVAKEFPGQRELEILGERPGWTEAGEARYELHGNRPSGADEPAPPGVDPGTVGGAG